MTEPEQVVLRATIERKQQDLPRFVVVPAGVVAPWALAGTTVVEVGLDGASLPRRTLKAWDRERWFLTITEADCRHLGLDTGQQVQLVLARASEELPAELAELLETEPRARAAWERCTPSQQRMLREEVAAGKRAATRTRRARRALLGE